jgi:PAS domain S-box-containing protein
MTVVRSRSKQRREDEQLLEAAVWAADLGLYEWDITSDTVRWLNDWCRHYDIDPCEGPRHGIQWRERVHPDDRARARHEYDEHIAGRRDRYEAEYRIHTLGGQWRWIRNRGYIVRSGPGGRHRRLMGICVDVDERKRIEAALDHSRRSLEALAAAAPIWMVLTDADGNIEFLNRPLAQRGIEPASVIGRPVTVLAADPEEARRIDAIRKQVVRSAQPQMHTMLLKDGRAIATWANPLLEAGRVVGIAAVIIDVSERRNRERDLLDAVAGEQRRFAHDLHDGLGQELTGIALLLKTLVTRVATEAPSLSRPLGEVLDYINGAIATSREVARGVSPVGREHGGLAEALNELAERVQRQGGPQVSYRVGGQEARELDPLLAENLYRIAQEAITNAVRHSGARQITLGLERSPTRVRLSVEDDGSGIPVGADDRAGLGLRIMRARAELVGARLVIGPRAPHGTRVECSRDWSAPGGEPVPVQPPTAGHASATPRKPAVRPKR